ncbi:MAG TPA: M28 family metallopeptidase [Thermoleophilaceae bacterium]|nr:M28 family metallopeptidase [Thermoleophilaceae bacterium]
MKGPLVAVLLIQLTLGAAFALWAALGELPFSDGGDGGNVAGEAAANGAARPDGFNEARAFRFLERQVRLGPRPAGSRASRRLAAELRRLVPGGRYQRVPGGLRNVVGRVAGRDRGRFIVVGAHYDTKDIPGFVGANDAAGGTAAVLELARSLEPRTIGPTVVFVFFDGEESPGNAPDSDFERLGLRGSKVAARAYRRAEAMILLDFVADRDLRIPREANSDPALWAKLRSAARRAGVIRHFPDATAPAIADDHIPFLRRGVPSIDLIDFDFPCFHRTCDDLSAVSERSLDVTGETVRELLASL